MLAGILAVTCIAQNPKSIRREHFNLQLNQKLNMEILAETLDIEEDQITVSNRGILKIYSPDIKLEFAQEKWHVLFHVIEGKLAKVEMLKHTTSLTSMLPLYNSLERMLSGKYADVGKHFPETIRKDSISESRKMSIKDERTNLSIDYDNGLVFNTLSLTYGDIHLMKIINSAIENDL